MKADRLMNPVLLGSINLSSIVVVSDPVYQLDNGYNLTIYNVLSGKYNVYLYARKIYLNDFLSMYRLAALYVTHESVPDPINKKINPETIGFNVEFDNIGVDSASCGIYDYFYYRSNWNLDSTNWFNKTNPYLERNYNKELNEKNVVASKIGYSICDNMGVTTESGWGDGVYSCLVKKNDNELINSIYLDFWHDYADKE